LKVELQKIQGKNILAGTKCDDVEVVDEGKLRESMYEAISANDVGRIEELVNELRVHKSESHLMHLMQDYVRGLKVIILS
jgi:hypothetical protein